MNEITRLKLEELMHTLQVIRKKVEQKNLEIDSLCKERDSAIDGFLGDTDVSQLPDNVRAVLRDVARDRMQYNNVISFDLRAKKTDSVRDETTKDSITAPTDCGDEE